MFHQRLALGSALCVAACAQIAGFEQLSSHARETGGGGSSAGKSEASAGRTSTSDSAGAAGGLAPDANSDAGAPDAAAGLSGGGAPSTGGTLSGGGAPSTGGTGGRSASGGSAPTAGGGVTAGSAGSPPLGACNSQLLRNPEFDQGPVEWENLSKAPGIFEVSDLIVDSTNQNLAKAGVAPKTGSYLAWLGGVLDGDKGSKTTLVQDVIIPRKVSRLVVSGFIQIHSTEPDPKYCKDQIDLTLQDDNDYWSFHFWNGTEVTTDWKAFSYEIADGAILDQLRDRRLTFYAEAINDTELVSSFWLDSLSLIAECPH